MRLRGVLQRVLLVDRDFHLAAGDHVEQILGGGEQVLALGGVGVQRRARREQRALGLQQMPMLNASIGPDALPKIANMPSGRMQSSDAGNVVLPMPS